MSSYKGIYPVTWTPSSRPHLSLTTSQSPHPNTIILGVKGFPGSSAGKKNLPAMQETPVQFLRWEGLLEKGQATHSSILGLSW